MPPRGCCGSFFWRDRASPLSQLVMPGLVRDEPGHDETTDYRRSLKNSRSSATDTLSPTPE
jgi:hypothetical protein